MSRAPRLLVAVVLATAGGAPAGDQRPAPFADVHTHYKWNQAEVTTPAEALAALERAGVVLAVVIGTPAERALELADLPNDRVRVLPLFGPYRQPGDWYRWYHDEGLLERARAALATGRYHGIGELHLLAGFAPDWRTPVISGLIALADEYDLPMLLHTEASRPNYLIDMCRANPDTRFLWAHAGAILPPARVRSVIEACPNLWVELSARDRWRYTASPIVDEQGHLLPEWKALIIEYPDRFMTGSDAVWPVEQLNPWDEPDTGWERIGDFVAFHRRWLADLPPPIEERVRLTNALRFFGVSD